MILDRILSRDSIVTLGLSEYRPPFISDIQCFKMMNRVRRPLFLGVFSKTARPWNGGLLFLRIWRLANEPKSVPV